MTDALGPSGPSTELEASRRTSDSPEPQLTARSFVAGALVGAFMAFSTLYVGLKTGLSVGVTLTAVVVGYSALRGLARLAPKTFGAPPSLAEAACMQSTASAAGFSTGSVYSSAIAALLLVRGEHLPWPTLLAWTFFMALLGVVVAIPLRRPMVEAEELPFPSGIAAAEALRSLGGATRDAGRRARLLFASAGLSGLATWLRDAHAASERGLMAFATKASVLPSLASLPGLGGVAVRYGFGLDLSPVLFASGALIGLRTTASMVAGGLVAYAWIGPTLVGAGIVARPEALVSWNLWPGAALLVASGLTRIALRAGTIRRALRGALAVRARESFVPDPAEVPARWFAVGLAVAAAGLVATGALAFDIPVVYGLLAVTLAFCLAVVACRVAGETDTTPAGPLGKITQLTYGVLLPHQLVANIAAACITAGAAASAADLMTDFKTGYLLGVRPRQQFLAQLGGCLVGTLVVVPAFYVLVPHASVLGGATFPAPSARVWQGVAQVLAGGPGALHPSARFAAVVAAALAVVVTVVEERWPALRAYLPSPVGFGFAFVLPFSSTLSFFIGAVLVRLVERLRPQAGAAVVVPVAAGLVTGESLVGVAIAMMRAAGLLA